MQPDVEIKGELAFSKEVRERFANAERLRREAKEIKPKTRILGAIAECIADEQEQAAKDLALGSLEKREREAEAIKAELETTRLTLSATRAVLRTRENDSSYPSLEPSGFLDNTNLPTLKRLLFKDTKLPKSPYYDEDNGRFIDNSLSIKTDPLRELYTDREKPIRGIGDFKAGNEGMSFDGRVNPDRPHEIIPEHHVELPRGRADYFGQELSGPSDPSRYSFLRRAIEDVKPPVIEDIDLGLGRPTDPTNGDC